MKDIAPELLEEILAEFDLEIKDSGAITELLELIGTEEVNYSIANKYAEEVGRILAGIYKRKITSDILPDGRMYFNIAERIVGQTLEKGYGMVADIAEAVQESLNASAGIGIKTIRAEINSSRIDGIVNRISSELQFDDIKWILDAPVRCFIQSVVDDFIKVNAEFHGEVGLKPRIIRKSSGHCCEWCARIAGTYLYPDVPKDVYRRHDNCNCTVEYYPEKGKKRQDVWSKEWKDEKDSDKIKIRQAIGTEEAVTAKQKRIEWSKSAGLADRIAGHPKILQAYTPEKLKNALEKAGYQVEPMGNGNLKGIPFEEGGGYKVNFGGDGILMYHPEKRSHHNGEYYKISTGKGGKHRYDRFGNEKED